MSEPRIAKSGHELREEVEQLIRDDLIGPLGGPEEELLEPPVDRYLLGLLAPHFGSRTPSSTTEEQESDPIAADAQPEDPLANSSVSSDSGWEGTPEDRPPAVDQLVPSAFGLTFCLDSDCETLLVDASWGAYSRAVSEEKLDYNGHPAQVWRRRQCGGTQAIALTGPGPIARFVPDHEEPEVVVRGLVRERQGQRLVSLFLVNEQQADSGRSVPLWLCQASLTVRAPNDEPVFVRRRLDAIALAPKVDRSELAGLEMLYRTSIELAVGHGIAVKATPTPQAPDRGVKLCTAAMPTEDVPRTEAPGIEDFEDEAVREPFTRALAALDMRTLSQASDGEITSLLTPLVEAYERWIEQQATRVEEPGVDLNRYADTARGHLQTARDTARRMREGIDALGDHDVADAFRFANHAMWQQRVHTIAADIRRREPALKLHEALEVADVASNRSWRPFQLAFVLLNLPALADARHPDRTSEGLLDLLFFPTGGGKTEAYLGLTAFAIAIRRLQGVIAGRDGRDGVAVLMRYTLRLLTLQQFQRAAALLCACELRRRHLYGKGDTESSAVGGRRRCASACGLGARRRRTATEDADRWVKAGPPAQRSGSRRLAAAARTLPVVRLGAQRWARRRSRWRPWTNC